MTDEHSSEVLGALPRTRPHRRSDKRANRPERAHANGTEPAVEASSKPKPVAAAAKPKPVAAAAKPKPVAAATRGRDVKRVRASRPERLRQPAQPAGTPRTPRAAQPVPSGRPDVIGTAVQAAAELAEIGLSMSARAIRRAVSRLPRP
jgi:hypothetical protein